MYTSCVFKRDRDNGILETNQAAFAENMEHYNVIRTLDIPGSPDVDHRPRKDGEAGRNEMFGSIRPWLGISVSCGWQS